MNSARAAAVSEVLVRELTRGATIQEALDAANAVPSLNMHGGHVELHVVVGDGVSMSRNLEDNGLLDTDRSGAGGGSRKESGIESGSASEGVGERAPVEVDDEEG